MRHQAVSVQRHGFVVFYSDLYCRYCCTICLAVRQTYSFTKFAVTPTQHTMYKLIERVGDRVQPRLGELENEYKQLSGSQSELQRDVHELCELVLDIASNMTNRRDPPRRNTVVAEPDRDAASQLATRQFVVRFNYDPLRMSPNADPESELRLRAGECVTVFGSVDSVSLSGSQHYPLYHSSSLNTASGTEIASLQILCGL